MDVGMAETRGLDPDANLAGLELETWHILDDEGLVEAVHHHRPVGARLRLEADRLLLDGRHGSLLLLVIPRSWLSHAQATSGEATRGKGESTDASDEGVMAAGSVEHSGSTQGETSSSGRARETLGALLDPEQHLPFHHERLRLHRKHSNPGREGRQP